MSKKNQKCFGWKNRATWNFAMWMSNGEATIKVLLEHAEDDCLSYDDFIEALKIIFPDGATPDGFKLKDADLKELFESATGIVSPELPEETEDDE